VSLDEKGRTFPPFAQEKGRTGHYAGICVAGCLVGEVIVNGEVCIISQLTMS
jgi:hypothetical protein